MSQTATEILDIAQELTQKRGFNAFSYADISARIGIKKASIHYHFPSKTDLGIQLIKRYSDVFGAKLSELESKNTDPVKNLKGYINLYKQTLSDDRMCLCGMLASDISTMPAEINQHLEEFFFENEKWLTAVLKTGLKQGLFSFRGNPTEQAQFVLSSVQGALLLSRAVKSETKFNNITGELLKNLLVTN